VNVSSGTGSLGCLRQSPTAVCVCVIMYTMLTIASEPQEEKAQIVHVQ